MILPQTREQVRMSLVRYAAEAGARGLSASLLYQFVRSEYRRTFSAQDLAAEIQYLIDKGLLGGVDKPISPENAVFRVTAAGRDWLATQAFGEAES
jgi:hypothetical protein